MIHLPDMYMFHKWFVSALHDSLCNEVLKKGYNTQFTTIEQLYETAQMVEEASCYNYRMWHIESTHAAVSNTKPAAYKAQPLMGQARTVVRRENVMHHAQRSHAYNAPNPEQIFVQEKDSLMKLSYKQKLLP